MNFALNLFVKKISFDDFTLNLFIQYKNENIGNYGYIGTSILKIINRNFESI